MDAILGTLLLIIVAGWALVIKADHALDRAEAELWADEPEPKSAPPEGPNA